HEHGRGAARRKPDLCELRLWSRRTLDRVGDAEPTEPAASARRSSTSRKPGDVGQLQRRFHLRRKVAAVVGDAGGGAIRHHRGGGGGGGPRPPRAPSEPARGGGDEPPEHRGRFGAPGPATRPAGGRVWE